MIDSSYSGINVLTDNILHVILGVAASFSVGVLFYERYKLGKSVKELPYLNSINLIMGILFIISFIYNILFI